MTFPAITAVYAGGLAIFFVALSGWVVVTRVTHDQLHGDGGDAVLEKRMRMQANFAEYVPFALGLVALLEADGAGRGLVQGLLILLVVARLLHPFGMIAPKNAPSQYICRGGGILGTFVVILVAAVALLIRLA